jgi:SAM-dependent methyltransferase
LSEDFAIGTHSNDSTVLVRSRKAVKQTLRRFGLLKSRRKFVSAAAAAEYRRQLAEILKRDFRLAMHPLQSDPAFLPPPGLVDQVQGSNTADLNTFFGASHRDMAFTLEVLRAHGFDLTRMRRLLDFGVGTGRMLAQFLPFPLELHGVDVNPVAVDWTSKKLAGLATIALSRLDPPLSFNSGFFDLVIANSVFTHMPYDAMPGWIAELARVTTRGSCALITVHDFSKLPVEHQAAGWYERGKARGLHLNTYLSPERLTALWEPAFELLEIRRFPPRQAFVVARRR